MHAVAAFGPFRLHIGKRQLERDGRPVQIGSRALDILILLVQAAGEVVDKRTLLARVWPGVVVEESSIRAHIAGLRKALEDGAGDARYVANVPGRGYCFVAPVTPVEAGAETPAAPARVPPPPVAQLPAPLGRMVGRDAVIALLAERLASQRFLSVVGPGGIGKTTTAVALANKVAHDFDGTAVFVDLGAIGDRGLVLAAIASALGLRADGRDLASSILGFLRERRTLLILDGCEHVVDVAAAMCERIFLEAPATALIATSREPLRVEGEYVFRLPPLALPPEDEQIPPGDTIRYAAVQMFIERARAAGLDLTQEAEMPIVARLCRQLDGLPLAIELAAARASSFGIPGLAKLLDQRFNLHWQGRRTAHPRHQTMHAMLDWSYRLLTENERRVLRHLGVFNGLFSFADAIAVVLEPGEQEGDLIDALDALVAKSLIAGALHGSDVQYRLLDSTRAYAASCLQASDRLADMQRRHAHWICMRLENELGPDLIAFHGSGRTPDAARLGDVRAALEWAFSDGGDAGIAARLAAVASHVFLSMSLLGECGKWARQGLACCGGEARLEMTLQASLAVSMMFTSGDHVPIRQAIERGLALARLENAPQHQLWLLAGLHLLEVRLGDVATVFEVAERAGALAAQSGDARASRLSEWMLGMSHHLAGQQDAALRHCNPHSELQRATPPLLLFGFDQRIRALIVRTRALWLAGFADQATEAAHVAIGEAQRSGSPVSHCLALIYAATVFLWTGDLDTASATIDVLLDQSGRHGLSHYRRIAACIQGELRVRRGEVDAGAAQLAEHLPRLRNEQHEVLVWGFTMALAEGCAGAGRLQAAEALVRDALDGAGEARFDIPELLRLQAELTVRSDPKAIGLARSILWRAVDIAQAQSARAWSLRCATSLGSLALSDDDDGRSRQLLAATLATVHEGHATSDVRRARALLALLQP